MWPDNGLNAQCEGFKCVPGYVNYCYQCLLFLQSDFIAQKSQLEEYIISCSHICDFYTKFHCELNFIEQYWGTVKFHYRSNLKTLDIDAIGKNVLTCLYHCFTFIGECFYPTYLHCLKLILLQICKSVRSIYFCLHTRLVQHQGCVGKP
jgi:hypothetical protein